jgi:hypothetical protein
VRNVGNGEMWLVGEVRKYESGGSTNPLNHKIILIMENLGGNERGDKGEVGGIRSEGLGKF